MSEQVSKMKQKSLHDRKNQKSKQKTQAANNRQNHEEYWRNSKNACSRVESNSEHFMIETRLWNLAILQAFFNEDISKHAYSDEMSSF